jgi:uncharacterized protein Veg
MKKNFIFLIVLILLSYIGYVYKSPIKIVTTCYEQDECYPSFYNIESSFNSDNNSYHVVISIETNRDVVLYDYSSLLTKEMNIRAILLCKDPFNVKDIKMEITESFNPEKANNYIPDKFDYPYIKLNTAMVYCT